IPVVPPQGGNKCPGDSCMIRKIAGFTLLFSTATTAQTNGNFENRSKALTKTNLQTKYSADSEGLPSAPVAQTGTAPTNVLDTSAAAPSQSPSGSSSPAAPQYPAQTVPSSVGTSAARTLTIKDAEQIALKNNPQISVARLTAMASQQVARETRSAF